MFCSKSLQIQKFTYKKDTVKSFKTKIQKLNLNCCHDEYQNLKIQILEKMSKMRQ